MAENEAEERAIEEEQDEQIVMPLDEPEKQEEAPSEPEEAPLTPLGKPADEPEESEPEPKAPAKEEPAEDDFATQIYGLRTTANREDQVMDFLASNVKKRKLAVYSIIRPHGMRGYIFVEAADRQSAEEAASGIPYARGILPKIVHYKEIEHMLEQVKRDVDIRKNDIVEIISGPFKREQAKISRVDKGKEEVVVELLGAAVPIPITVKMDAVKVIRRESDEAEENE